ncbi:ABC transporter permease [Ammoniphilus sp. YIM 78166]|uniref:ABC transporter permease n=1 Tax=Ammoniphilus sp. YIM 78166 TaxID=1644106 RepID=UPI0010706135|nr:ABC transporter permease [Ammoniphilus sp. YIM 78166]
MRYQQLEYDHSSQKPDVIPIEDNENYVHRMIKQYIGSLGLFFIIIVFCVILSFLSPVFLTKTNLINLLIQSAILITLSVGVTFVMLTGGIDLSVGGVMAVSAAIGLGTIVYHDVPVILGVFISLLIGAAFGLFNGIMASRFHVPPLIVTLATMGMARGIVTMYTNGSNITPVPYSFVVLANDRLFGIPILIIVVAVLVLMAHIILKYTVFGRAVYATGGNEDAARLAGIRTRLIIIFSFIISGLMAATAGIFMTALLESAGSNAGRGIELTVITATVIGGTSLFGGQGNVAGTVLGAFLISLVANAVNLLGVPPAWETFVTASLILIAALLDVYRRKYLIEKNML